MVLEPRLGAWCRAQGSPPMGETSTIYLFSFVGFSPGWLGVNYIGICSSYPTHCGSFFIYLVVNLFWNVPVSFINGGSASAVTFVCSCKEVSSGSFYSAILAALPPSVSFHLLLIASKLLLISAIELPSASLYFLVSFTLICISPR